MKLWAVVRRLSSTQPGRSMRRLSRASLTSPMRCAQHPHMCWSLQAACVGSALNMAGSRNRAPGYVRSLQWRLLSCCERAVCCAVIWNQGGLRRGWASWKHSAPWRGCPCKEQLLLLKQQLGRCGVIYHAARTHLVPDRRGGPHRKHLQLEQQRGLTGSALCPRSPCCCSCCYWSTWPAVLWLDAAQWHQAM